MAIQISLSEKKKKKIIIVGNRDIQRKYGGAILYLPCKEITYLIKAKTSSHDEGI